MLSPIIFRTKNVGQPHNSLAGNNTLFKRNNINNRKGARKVCRKRYESRIQQR